MNFSRPEIFAEWSNTYTPNSGGIYMLLGHPLGNTYPVLYVGQSNELARRISEHLEIADSKYRGEIMYFVYALEPNPYTRDLLEASLIKKHNPRFNKLLKSQQPTELDELARILIANKEAIQKEKKQRIDALMRYLAQ
ncbi:GIY-YIG nuclease family protein [Paenibacillus lautus]|uniref:GIY-YIG nuclease family protein n=1 Tax=Paenibacillus lautus TaxID=1401 RepID=UPI003D2AFA06